MYIFFLFLAQPVRRPSVKYQVTDLMSNIVRYMMTVLVALKTHDIYSNQEFPDTEPLQQATSTLCDNSDHPAFCPSRILSIRTVHQNWHERTSNSCVHTKGCKRQFGHDRV